MKKKLSKTGKISLWLFGGLCVSGVLATSAFFWIQYQKKHKYDIDKNNDIPTINQQNNYLIPYEFPEIIDHQKIMNNYKTQDERVLLANNINKKELIEELIYLNNYPIDLNVQQLYFDENKIKTKLSQILLNCLLKSNEYNKIENFKIYYQLLNTKNVVDLKYNQLNVYVKWKCQSSISLNKKYYDLLSFSLN